MFRTVFLSIIRSSKLPIQQRCMSNSCCYLQRGGSSAVGRGRADWPDYDQQHCYHQAPKVKPEAATAVVELLMMGVRTPETC
jgi:hypothetical protein